MLLSHIYLKKKKRVNTVIHVSKLKLAFNVCFFLIHFLRTPFHVVSILRWTEIRNV